MPTSVPPFDIDAQEPDLDAPAGHDRILYEVNWSASKRLNDNLRRHG